MYYKQVIILITGKCNLRCKYCYASELNARNSMSEENIKKAVKLLDPYDSVLQISGGEPLCSYKKVVLAVNHARKTRPKSRVKLQTNATLVNDEVAAFMKDNDVNVNVSLDGTSFVNDDIRGDTKSTLNGIRILEENDVPINLTTVITSKNSDFLDRLAGIAILFRNVKSLSFDLIRKSGRAAENFNDLKADIGSIQKGIGKACSLFNKFTPKKFVSKEPQALINDIAILLSRSISKQIRPYYCYAAMGESITVLPTGKIFSCPSLINLKEGYLGDIEDSDILAKRTIRSVEDLRQCTDCKIKYACRGGCPARAYLESKNRLSINELECSYRMWLFDEFVEPLLNKKHFFKNITAR